MPWSYRCSWRAKRPYSSQVQPRRRQYTLRSFRSADRPPSLFPSFRTGKHVRMFECKGCGDFGGGRWQPRSSRRAPGPRLGSLVGGPGHLPDEPRRTVPLSQSMPDAIFRLAVTLGRISRMRLEQTITLGQMRQSGAPRLHVFCGDYKCSHSVVIDADCWPESLQLSDLEALFVCSVCSHRGADVRPDYQGAEPRLASVDR